MNELRKNADGPKHCLERAIHKRADYIREPYNTAFRLLNGFSEGLPSIVLEVFSKTLVCHEYGTGDNKADAALMEMVVATVREMCPWIETGIIKKRKSKVPEVRNGQLIFGSVVDKRIREAGIHYAIDLTMNRDTSFYLDTRELRKWARRELQGKSVLNTFSYTGSIGIAALVGGASEVMHLDLSKKFLNMARRSTDLNDKAIEKSQYQMGDFWSRVNQYKLSGKIFDCVILDPPVYSKTGKGVIDIAKNYKKVINKVRPIIADGGYLVTISNALFQSGQDHYAELEDLCKDGFLSIDSIIEVPEDCLGDIHELKKCLPADPAPYNHSTKITILRVKKKA
jgi:23S rRNA (cytosine1962-C5)-methyltransferase